MILGYLIYRQCLDKGKKKKANQLILFTGLLLFSLFVYFLFCGLTMTGQSQRKAEQRPAALFRLFCAATQEPPHDPFVVRHRSHRRLHSTILSGNH